MKFLYFWADSSRAAGQNEYQTPGQISCYQLELQGQDNQEIDWQRQQSKTMSTNVEVLEQLPFLPSEIEVFLYWKLLHDSRTNMKWPTLKWWKFKALLKREAEISTGPIQITDRNFDIVSKWKMFKTNIPKSTEDNPAKWMIMRQSA